MILKTFAIVAISGVSVLGSGAGGGSDALGFCPYSPTYGGYGVTALAGVLTPASVSVRQGHQRGGSITDADGFFDLLGHSSLLAPIPALVTDSMLEKDDPEEAQESEALKRSLRVERKPEGLNAKDFKRSFDPKRVDSPTQPNLRKQGRVAQPTPQGRRRN